MPHSLTVVATSMALMLIAATSATAATVVNGDFETGTLDGWSVDVEGNGNWFAYTGEQGPQSGEPVWPPPQGVFGATSDMTDAGSRILYQNVALEPGQVHNLSLIAYYSNKADDFANPATLDHTTMELNQQYRIDVMDPASDIRSVDTSDIHQTLLATEPGDPLSLPPTTITADLTALAGQTVRLRFAEVDNDNFLQAGVDAVSITTPSPPPKPCAGRTPTIVGTDGDDVLRGTAGTDVIAGLQGDDKLKGKGGKDFLCGADGADRLNGGGGRDRLKAGAGKDRMNGGGGVDRCKGGPGRDTDLNC